MEFDWDEANEAHIARHGVDMVETESIFTDPFGEIVDSEVFDEEMRYKQIGSTPGGRILIVIFTMREQAVRPVTAFEAGRSMARLYYRGLLN